MQNWIRHHLTKYSLVFLALCGSFFLLKLSNLSIRMSDTNIYIVMATHLMQGKLLYKDMFLTNLPLFPYISTIYIFLVGGNAPLFYLTSSVEAILTTVCIYLIVKKLGYSAQLATLSAGLYLFSGVVLFTSEHQTGIFFATLCATAAYLTYLYNKRIPAGILAGLAFAAKGYFLPVVVVLLGYSLWKDRRNAVPMIAAFAGTVLLIMVPTILFAFPQFKDQVMGYSLNRPQGIPKMGIFMFFLFYNILISLSSLYAVVRIKKIPVLGLISLGVFIFLLIYPDIYFFYLNMFAPFAAVSFAVAVADLQKLMKDEKIVILGIIGVIVSGMFSLSNYFDRYREIQKINHPERLVAAIQAQHPTSLYGGADFTPGLSYLSGVPLLDDIIDTNENLVVRGKLDPQSMTKKLLSTNTLLIAYGAYYPEYGVDDPMLTTIVDKKTALKRCTVLYSHPVLSEGSANRINVFSCKKDN